MEQNPPLAFTADPQQRVRANRTSANFRLGQLKSDTETPNPISQTVPDQALSLSELLHRYARGQHVPTREGVYLGDEEVPDLEKLDYFERIELKEQNAEHIAEIRQRLQTAEVTKQQKPAAPKRKSEAEQSATSPTEGGKGDEIPQ